MTDFYQKYKDLFEGNEELHKINSQAYQGGISQSQKFKTLFDRESEVPLRQTVIQLDQNKIKPQLFGGSSYQTNVIQVGGQITRLPLTSSTPLISEKPRNLNSRQGQKRDILATNAERLLSRQNDPYPTLIDAKYSPFLNKFEGGYSLNIENNNSNNFGGGALYKYPSNSQLAPPLPQQLSQQQKQVEKTPEPTGYSNITPFQKIEQRKAQEALLFEAITTQANQNFSKLKKYQDLHGDQTLYPQTQSPLKNNQKQYAERNQIESNKIVQHFEERNQGLIDYVNSKKKFAQHKVISDISGIPGHGSYRQAIMNRIQAAKKSESRKQELTSILRREKIL